MTFILFSKNTAFFRFLMFVMLSCNDMRYPLSRKKMTAMTKTRQDLIILWTVWTTASLFLSNTLMCWSILQRPTSGQTHYVHGQTFILVVPAKNHVSFSLHSDSQNFFLSSTTVVVSVRSIAPLRKSSGL